MEMDIDHVPVLATRVSDAERKRSLPRHFGRFMMVFENAVYTHLGRMSEAYNGGFWTFYELSNGGFYMAPVTDKPVHLAVEGNGYEGEMSADAAGIVACLAAYSHLSFGFQREEIVGRNFAEHFHQLRMFAGEHAEAPAIFAAID